jgi:hypothetical protein
MDSIDVPIYLQSDRTRIDDALQELRRRKRGGLLVRGKDECRLLFAGDLLRARRDGISAVQRISGGQPVMVVTEEHARSHGVDLRDLQRRPREFETMMEHHQRSYAISDPRAPSSVSHAVPMLVTRSEELGRFLRMTGGYECNGDPKHFFPQPYASAGDDCPLYPECSRPDGSIPKVKASI